MQWHPRSEDKAAWSAAGGVVMAVGVAGAIAWLAIAEPSTSHEPLWPVLAFGVVAVVGLYGMLAPLLRWWPWHNQSGAIGPFTLTLAPKGKEDKAKRRVPTGHGRRQTS